MQYTKYCVRRLTTIFQHVLASADSMLYTGAVSNQNIGDEAMYEAVRSYFEPLPVVGAKPPKRLPFLARHMERKRHLATILGGGTLILREDTDCLSRFFEQYVAACDRSERSIVFGTGVGSVRDPETELAHWKPHLERCHFIGVRGPDSRQALSRLGIMSKVIGDPAACFVQAEGRWNPDRKRLLGVNIGHIVWDAPCPSQQPLNRALAEFISVQIRRGWQVEFFCVWPADMPVIETVAAMAGIKTPVVRCHFFDGASFVHDVGRLSAFVGMKLHSGILAMCAGVPTILIRYSAKCMDYMKSVNMARFCPDVGEASAGLLDSLFDELLKDSGAVSRCVLERLNSYRARQHETSQQLRRWLLNGSAA